MTTEARTEQFPLGLEDESQLTIAEHQEGVSHAFIDFYKQKGYIHHPPVSLLAETDSSVIFVGATITPLKPYLAEGVPSPGICMVQKCLRTKRMDEMTNIDIIPEWTHYFTMCGILASPDRGSETSDEAYDLLVNNLGISPHDLVIEASSDDTDLSNSWEHRGIQVVQNTHPQNYYRWQYGFSNVYGRGINFLLRIANSEEYRDLGNLISVQDTDGNTLAYEFGFGLESMISATRGFKRPAEASLVSSVIPYQEGLQEKIIDALMATMVIYREGIQPGRGGARHVVKKLIKGLSFLRRAMNIDLNQLSDWCQKFEQIEFGSSKNSFEIVEAVAEYEGQLLKFDNYARNQFHAHQLRGDSGERLFKKINKTGINMGILSVDIESILESLFTT